MEICNSYFHCYHKTDKPFSMTPPDRDPGLDNLVDFDGQTLFVDETGHCVKSVVLRTEVPSGSLPGISYSLTLHAPKETRLVGFNNSHPVTDRHGPGVQRQGESDHRHRLLSIRPYRYEDAATGRFEQVLLAGGRNQGRVRGELLMPSVHVSKCEHIRPSANTYQHIHHSRSRARQISTHYHPTRYPS